MLGEWNKTLTGKTEEAMLQVQRNINEKRKVRFEHLRSINNRFLQVHLHLYEWSKRFADGFARLLCNLICFYLTNSGKEWLSSETWLAVFLLFLLYNLYSCSFILYKRYWNSTMLIKGLIVFLQPYIREVYRFLCRTN